VEGLNGQDETQVDQNALPAPFRGPACHPHGGSGSLTIFPAKKGEKADAGNSQRTGAGGHENGSHT